MERLYELLLWFFFFFFFFERIPELPPVVEGSEAVFHPEKFPSFEHATPRAVVTGGLRLCLETDTAIQRHIQILARGKYCSGFILHMQI